MKIWDLLSPGRRYRQEARCAQAEVEEHIREARDQQAHIIRAIRREREHTQKAIEAANQAIKAAKRVYNDD